MKGKLSALLLSAAGAVILCASIWHTVKSQVPEAYLLRYEPHFVRRGLVGTLLHGFVRDPIPKQTIQAIAVATLAAVLVLLGGWVLAFLRSAWGWNRVALVCLFLLSPFTIRHMVWDLGRFDLLNYGIALGALVVVKRRRRFVVPALLVPPLLLLVHQAALFLTIPLYLSIWWWLAERSSTSADTMRMTVEGAGILIVAALIMLTAFGNFHDLHEHYQLIEQRAAFETTIVPYASLQLSVTDHLRSMWAYHGWDQPWIEVLLIVAAGLCWALFPLQYLWRQIDRKTEWSHLFPVLAPVDWSWVDGVALAGIALSFALVRPSLSTWHLPVFWGLLW